MVRIFSGLVLAAAATTVTAWPQGSGTTTPAGRPTGLTVSGGDLEWRIETPSMVVDFSKNPGTGRSGQINTILDRRTGVLLTRNRPTSTLHLSPNSAAGPRWNGINRWDPPAMFAAAPTNRGFRIDREGPMPFVPGLHVRARYEILAAEPVIEVEESVTARADAAATLLRLCEWSFSPQKENPWTGIAWEDATGKVTMRPREKEEELPLDLRWMAFLNRQRRLGFAAVVEQFDTGGFRLHPASRFAGDPHYFYRVLVASPEGGLVTIPRGSRWSIRYSIYLFEPGAGDQAAAPVMRFARSREAR